MNRREFLVKAGVLFTGGVLGWISSDLVNTSVNDNNNESEITKQAKDYFHILERNLNPQFLSSLYPHQLNDQQLMEVLQKGVLVGQDESSKLPQREIEVIIDQKQQELRNSLKLNEDDLLFATVRVGYVLASDDRENDIIEFTPDLNGEVLPLSNLPAIGSATLSPTTTDTVWRMENDFTWTNGTFADGRWFNAQIFTSGKMTIKAASYLLTN